jgi:antitoxin (DNA-binding transcriptional repressor) of toxin-antitoxin stability system
MKASVMDLRYRTREILRALEEGAEITLTHRGKVKGRILPLRKASAGTRCLAEHEAVGMWADQTETVEEMVERIRKPRTAC